MQGSAGCGRADTSGNHESIVGQSLSSLAAERCVSDSPGLHIDAGGGSLMENDGVLELRVLLEALHDGLEVLVVGSILHRDKLSGCTNVPPEVSRLVDDVQDIFGIWGLGELRQGVLDDIVSSTQSSEVGAENNDVTRLRHDGRFYKALKI
jgi:hypothetical protein